MDISLIFSGFLSMAVFILLQIIIFRNIDGRKVMTWLVKIFIFTVIFHIFFIIITKDIFFPKLNIFGAILISLTIYISLAYFYVTAIFGISVTSVRIQILSLICKQGKKGLSENAILKAYNKEKIVGTRLERLTGSKVLNYTDGKYKLRNGFSPYMFNTYFHNILKKIYVKPEKYENKKGK